MQRHDQGGGVSAARIRAAGAILLAAHLLIVGWFTLRPRPVPWVAPSNWNLFATIRADLASGAATALESIGGGLLLLAPLGLLLPLATGQLHRSLPGTAARTVSSGLLVALGLALLRSGVPGQVVNVDTVMLHILGVALAHFLGYPPLRARLRRGGDRRVGAAGMSADIHRCGCVEASRAGTQGTSPRSSRVGIAP